MQTLPASGVALRVRWHDQFGQAVPLAAVNDPEQMVVVVIAPVWYARPARSRGQRAHCGHEGPASLLEAGQRTIPVLLSGLAASVTERRIRAQFVGRVPRQNDLVETASARTRAGDLAQWR